MDIETLELFIEVMRTRNFTDIARARGVAASSISRSITALENSLDTRLFQRTTRKLEPTEAGLIYYDQLCPILEALHAANQMASDLNATPRGKLRLTAATVYGEMQIIPLLPDIQLRYPQLSLEIILSDSYLDLVKERIDIAVRVGSLEDSSYIARRINNMTFHACASPAYLASHDTPLTPQQLTTHNCLLLPRSGYNFNWLFKETNGTVHNVPIQGNCLITHSNSIRLCALANMGVALLPDWLVEKDIQSGKLIKLLDDYEATPTDYNGAIWLMCPTREYMPLKTRVIMDYLTAALSRVNSVAAVK